MKAPTAYLKRLRFSRGASAPLAVCLAISLAALSSCLGEPEVDERWTLLEFEDVSPSPGRLMPADQPINVSVTGRITYRSILTGFLVAEVRYSDTVPPSVVSLDPGEHTEEIAADIDRILANSVTAGRATQIVTGFDHLIHEVDLSFVASVPPAMFAGGSATGGLYLLLYLGDGEEIELPSGADSLVVTPFVSSDVEVLHTGFVLNVTPPGGAPQP